MTNPNKNVQKLRTDLGFPEFDTPMEPLAVEETGTVVDVIQDLYAVTVTDEEIQAYQKEMWKDIEERANDIRVDHKQDSRKKPVGSKRATQMSIQERLATIEKQLSTLSVASHKQILALTYKLEEERLERRCLEGVLLSVIERMPFYEETLLGLLRDAKYDLPENQFYDNYEKFFCTNRDQMFDCLVRNFLVDAHKHNSLSSMLELEHPFFLLFYSWLISPYLPESPDGKDTPPDNNVSD